MSAERVLRHAACSSAAAVLWLGCLVALAMLTVRVPQSEKGLQRPVHDTVTGSVQRVKGLKPLDKRRAGWMIKQLSRLHSEGILDRVDYADAVAKIKAKVGKCPLLARTARQGAYSARATNDNRGDEPGSRTRTALSPAETKVASGVLAAIKKLQYDHSYIQKQIVSGWRQDIASLRAKDKLLAEQMQK